MACFPGKSLHQPNQLHLKLRNDYCEGNDFNIAIVGSRIEVLKNCQLLNGAELSSQKYSWRWDRIGKLQASMHHLENQSCKCQIL